MRPRTALFASVVLLALVMVIILTVQQSPPGGGADPKYSLREPLPGNVANIERPGQTLNYRGLAVPGKTTVVEFYSPYNEACTSLEPKILALASRRADLVVRKLNVNRPGVPGTDLDSPLSIQYHLNTLPEFKVMDGQGRLKAEGPAARKLVADYLVATLGR